MRLKYYLRGLGIGIIVTIVFSSVYHNGKDTELTDDEIIARAKALGMIENTTLGDIEDTDSDKEIADEPESGNELDEPVQESPNDEPIKEDSDVKAPTEEEPTGTGNEEDLPIEGDSTSEDIVSPEDNSGNTEAEGNVPDGDNKASGDTEKADDSVDVNAEGSASGMEVQYVDIIVERGDASYTVCLKLVNAGVIEDAREFDSYLSQNGYDKRVRTGSHKVPVGGTYEEIAKAIASN